MAETWAALTTACAWSTSAKVMLSLFNASGSGKIVRLYRAWIIQTQTTAVTGVVAPCTLVRITAQSAGTTVTPVKYDTGSAALPAQITSGTGTTVTQTDIFRYYKFSTDEPSVGTAITFDEYYCSVPLSVIWDGGYGDSNVEPIVCREGQGVAITTAGIASATGTADFLFEFTVT